MAHNVFVQVIVSIFVDWLCRIYCFIVLYYTAVDVGETIIIYCIWVSYSLYQHNHQMRAHLYQFQSPVFTSQYLTNLWCAETPDEQGNQWWEDRGDSWMHLKPTICSSCHKQTVTSLLTGGYKTKFGLILELAYKSSSHKPEDDLTHQTQMWLGYDMSN